MAENKQSQDLIKLLSEALKQANVNNNINSENASNVALEINRKINEKSQKQKDYAHKIANEMNNNKNIVAVSVPSIYKQYQPSFVISINGCTIKIPSDGVTRYIHKDFAIVLNRRLRALDRKIEFMRSNPDGNILEIPSTFR